MPAVANRLLYLIVYGVVAVGIGWLVVTGAVAAHYRQTAPERAVQWRPNDPEPHKVLAEQALEAGRLETVRAHALVALPRSPHDATVYRLLGQAAGDSRLAQRFFAQAGRLTHRDATLAAIFFERAVAERRWSAAMTQAEILIRRSPRSEGAVLFRLAVLARDPEFASVLAAALAHGPNWRAAFFRELGGSNTHIPAAMRIIDGMRAAGAPVEPGEITRLLNRMVAAGQPAEARRLWTRLAAPRASGSDVIHDPTFRDSRAYGPFGWTVGERIRSQVSFASSSTGPGLMIDRNGLEPERLVRQTLVLPPGRYEIESAGRWRSGEPMALAWQVACPGAGPVPIELAGPEPVVVRGEFVATEDCPAPLLSLMAVGRDRNRPSSGTIDHVKVRRLD